MNPEEQAKRVNELVAKCWEDEGFKRQLMADPVATLQAQGVELPPGMKIQVVENTDQAFTLVIPPKPEDLSDEELDGVVGGLKLVTTNTTYSVNSTIYLGSSSNPGMT
jgi:hypothetical protein